MSKKIIAIVTSITCAVWMMGPAVTSAATVEELQAQINNLLAQLATLQSQLGTAQGGTSTAACTGITFSRTLKQGMSGNDVKCLQSILNSDAATQIAASGAGSPGNETTYFGALTKAAVVKFQNKYAAEILTPIGLTAGTGVVGAKTIAKLNTMLGGGGGTTPTPTPTPVPTTATISLAADTPAAGAVAKGAKDSTMLKVKFTAGSDAYTISKIVVARGGVSADADLASITLYDGTTRLGSTQALNTTTHKATFSGLSWQIPASSTKYLTVVATVCSATLCSAAAVVGDQLQLGIAASDDVTSTVTLGGTFPIWGNAFMIAGASVGQLDVDKQTAPAAATILSGATDQEIAAWKFAASSTEGFSIKKIKITHVGSAAATDISNIKLKYAGTQIGSTVATLASDNTATFDLSSAPLVVNAGGSKIVYAYCDVAPGIWTTRTVIFEITQYTDVQAIGANSGGEVTITYSSGTSFSKQTGNTMSIGQGTLTSALDSAQNPSAQNYVKGTTNRLFTALKFSTGSREGARITELKLKLGGTGSATDISNITLWDGTTQIAGPASIIGTYVTFGTNTIGFDSTGVVDVAASSNKTLLVKGDIASGATSSNTVSLSINAASDVKADGLASKYDIPAASVTGTATGNAHTVTASGTLAISLASTSPSAQTYVKGATAKEFTKLNFTAGSGEDISVSAITINAYDGSGTGTALTSGDITNVKVLKSDGTQYGNTVSTGTSSMSFSGNLTVPAASTVLLSVVADIPTSSAPANSAVHIDLLSVSTNVTSTGVSSAADLTETGSATGNLMTFGQGALTVAVAATPADQTVIKNATSIPYVAFTFTATTAEDVRVTSVTLSRTSSGTGAYADISNVALFNGTTRLTAYKPLTDVADSGDTVDYVQFSASDFLNSLGFDIAKGTQKTITVYADAPSTATAGQKNALGIKNAAAVVFTGLSSNTTPTTTLTAGPTNCTNGTTDGANYTTGGDADCYEVLLAAAGTLTSSVATDTPTTTIVSVGPEGTLIPDVAFTKFYFSASMEDIELKTLMVTRSGGSDADFSAIKLYQGTTLLATQTLSGGTTTFNFAAGSRPLIPKGASGTQYFTIKGDMNGIATAIGYGSSTGDAPILNIAATTDIVGQGKNSGTDINGSATVTGNAMYVRQATPTLASSTLPTSTLSSGTKVLYKWTHTSSATGETGWKYIAFHFSGSIHTDASTVKTIGTDDSTTPVYDGIYLLSGDGNTTADTKLIDESSMKIYNSTTNTQVTGTWYFRTDTDANGGTYAVFVPTTEEAVSAGGTKIYELRGDVAYGGYTGDSILTKISDLASSVATDTYDNVAGTNDADSGTSSTSTTVSFVWSDRSGAGGAHSTTSADWANDYKVTGVPTSTLTLSK